MTAQEIRQSFLDFFKSKRHSIVSSAPVVPHGDPTLLFTNAGMNQFKDVFLGTGKRDYTRAADTQKCIRVSGKHNDLEEVGVDTYHHTFFEMLGNWSFDDYYKAEAIAWAWELLVDVWKLPVERLHATVYRTDDEAFELWKKYLPESRIHRFDEKDNFWEMGETGPCGPCSEIHFDRTPDLSGGKLVNAGSPDVIEIWNLVFIQYNRKASGDLEPLSSTHVDTGMGFERITAVIQGKYSNYDTDVFMPIIHKVEEISGVKYDGGLEDRDSIAMRVLADHVRTLSFAIADGAMPGKEGRGYVLRRILRRGLRFAGNLGIKEPVIYKLVPTLIDNMGLQFPELVQNRDTILRVIKSEEESFINTLQRGLEIFDNITKKLSENNLSTISGDDAFQLYDTFGFPLDLTQLLARERNFIVDEAGFNQNMKEQKARSRAARKVTSQEAETIDAVLKSEFLGYTTTETESKVIFADENKIALEATPFYTESGGQISDTGIIILAGEAYDVIDVRKIGNAIVHYTDREVEPLVGQYALAKVDSARRRSIMRNHSATHLMHEALRRLLGDHIKQAGSLVSPDYLRFDFNHFERVDKAVLREIEQIVNEKILEAITVDTRVIPLEEAAKNPKVRMFFGDKYGDVVRLVTMDPKYSMELCGGTHVKNTSEIGFFKIISESSISAGVRRVEAITGAAVQNYLYGLIEKIGEKEVEKEDLLQKIKHLEKENSAIKLAGLESEMKKLAENAQTINGVRFTAHKFDIDSAEELRSIAEKFRDIFVTNGISLSVMVVEGKVQIAVSVTDDLTAKYPAGKLIGVAAKVLGGGGGGKPHLATAGAKDDSKLNELISNFGRLIAEFSN